MQHATGMMYYLHASRTLTYAPGNWYTSSPTCWGTCMLHGSYMLNTKRVSVHLLGYFYASFQVRVSACICQLTYKQPSNLDGVSRSKFASIMECNLYRLGIVHNLCQLTVHLQDKYCLKLTSTNRELIVQGSFTIDINYP